MDTTSYLFHAANFEPEVHRIENSIAAGHTERARIFIEKTLKIIDAVLSAKDVSMAGKEEWFVVQSLVASYEQNDAETNRALLAYGHPFAQKFARG